MLQIGDFAIPHCRHIKPIGEVKIEFIEGRMINGIYTRLCQVIDERGKIYIINEKQLEKKE